MNVTYTGIATGIALAIISLFFIFPSLWPFSSTGVFSSSNPTPPMEGNTSLKLSDDHIGSGDTATIGDIVTVEYVGKLTDGTIFDASKNHGNEGFTFALGAGQVIQGWDQGIVGMKVGGKRTLVIPPELAYGSQAIGNIIPANSTLIFEVELLRIQK